MKRFCATSILLLLFTCANAQYNFYYGNIHAHSGYSDGNKDSSSSLASTPADNYAFAKNSYHFDFLGISEHNHYQAGMKTPANYHAGKYQADTSNQDGSFVSLYGMEWGVISNGGHVIIYGVDSLIGWDMQADNITPDYDIYCSKYNYNGLWQILHNKPGSFATLAHPDTYDFDSLNQRSYNGMADSIVVGVALRSGSAFSTTKDYTDAPASMSEAFYRKMLARGYRVAPTIDHDNHNTTFGRTNMTRTVVLAQSLVRDSILDAYRKMRFYASDDWNTQLYFTVNGQQMGTDNITFNNSSIAVTVNDPDPGDNVSKIDLFYGVPGSGTNATVLTTISGSPTLNYVHNTSFGQAFYYYAKITQTDGNIIWSAPVWMNRTGSPLPVNIISFTGKAFDEKVQTNWLVEEESEMDYYSVERSTDGQQYRSIGTVPSRNMTGTIYSLDDNQPQNGLNFYRLQQVSKNGSIKYSQIITVNYKRSLITFKSLYPNPVKNNLHVRLSAISPISLTAKVYSTAGQLMQEIPVQLQKGENRLNLEVSRLLSGTYYLVLYSPKGRMAESPFIKQ